MAKDVKEANKFTVHKLLRYENYWSELYFLRETSFALVNINEPFVELCDHKVWTVLSIVAWLRTDLPFSSSQLCTTDFAALRTLLLFFDVFDDRGSCCMDTRSYTPVTPVIVIALEEIEKLLVVCAAITIFEYSFKLIDFA